MERPLTKVSRLGKGFLVILAVVVIVAAGAVFFIFGGGGEEAPSTQPPTTTPSPTTTAPPTTTQPPPTTQPPETSVEVEKIETLCDLIESWPERAWRWSNSNGSWSEGSYRVIGSESIGGIQTIKVNASLKGDNVEPQTATIWLDASECKVVQIRFQDGTVMSGPFAEQLGDAMLRSASVILATTNEITTKVLEASTEGVVTSTDLGIQNIAGKNMHVIKYTWTPPPGSEEQNQISKIVVNVGQLKADLWVVVYWRVDFVNGGWEEFEVTEL